MNKITLLVTIYARPGTGEELKKLVVVLALNSSAEPGNIYYRSFLSAGDQLFIFEQWQDQEALDKHNESPHLKKFSIDSASLIAGEVNEISLTEFC